MKRTPKRAKLVPASAATLFSFLMAGPALANHHQDIASNRLFGVPDLSRHAIHLGLNHTNNFRHSPASLSLPITPVGLDLASSSVSISLQSGVIRKGDSVEILVGGNKTIFHTGDKVTAAELVAIDQVQNDGQKLHLDELGRADGGNFSLKGVVTALQISSIVIPKNVTALDNITARSSVSLGGDLLNYGSIVDTVRGGHVSSTISALNISNEVGGSITFDGHATRASSVDLSLNASNEFNNQGSIASSGSLNIQAGNLTNAGTVTGVNDVNVNSGVINNSGIIASHNGNLNINAPLSNNLVVSNVGGTLSALNGAINVRDASYNGTNDSTISGGNLLSQTVNLNAGAGNANVDVDNISGVVSSSGNAAHVNVNNGDLTLGAQVLSGDPTYYNSGGSINLTADLVVSEKLVIIASGDITASSGVTQITAQNAGQGFDINIIAGANVVTSGGGGDSTTTIPGTKATSNVSYTGASTSGGKIDFSGANANLQINANSTTGNNNGANVTLAAYGGLSATSGEILLPVGSNINASGAGTGFAGNVTLAGKSSNSTGIQLGGITNGALAGARFVFVSELGPAFSSGTSMTFDTTGSITSGNFITAIGDFSSFTSSGGTINIAGNVISSASTTISTPNAASLKGITASGIGVIAGGDIDVGGNLISSNGILLASIGNVASTVSGLTISTASTTGNGGPLSVIAGESFQVTGSSVTFPISIGTHPFGSIDFSTNPIAVLSSQTTFTNAHGGDMRLQADSFGGAGGHVSLPSSLTVTTGGNGTGLTGNFSIFAFAQSGTAISIGNVVETGAAVPFSAFSTNYPNTDPPFYGISLQTQRIYYIQGFSPNADMFSTFGAYIVPGQHFGEFPGAASATAGDIVTGNLSGSGQTVTIVTAGNVHVPNIDTSGGATGSGGYVSVLTGPTPLAAGGASTSNWVGAINASGGTISGNAGSINLQSLGPVGGTGSITVVDPTAFKVALTSGNGPGLTFITSNLDLGTMSPTIDVSGKVNGDGGTVNILADKITWLNQATMPLTLIANGAGIGDGGFVGVTTGSQPVLFVGSKGGSFQGSANSGASNGDGGTLSFNNPGGDIELDIPSITITSAGNGNGGKLTLLATHVTGPANFTVNVNGSGTGNGGQIELGEINTSAPHVFDLANSGQFNAKAGATGGGHGGSLSIVTSGTLSLDSSQFNVGPQGNAGSGGNVDFEGAILDLSGNLNLDAANGGQGGAGGNITLVSTGPGALNIDIPLSAQGTFSPINGRIQITSVGSITNSVPITKFTTLSETVTGTTGSITSKQSIGSAAAQTITFNTAGSGSITFSKFLQATTVNATSATGKISLTDFIAQQVSATTSATTGSVALTEDDAATLPLTVTAAAGKTVTIESVKSISTSGPITGGKVTIESTSKATPGDITVGGTINATGLVTLATSGNITNNAAITGLGIKETGSGATSLITVNGNLSGGTAGDVTLSSSQNNITLNAGSDISGDTVTLTASKGTATVNGTIGNNSTTNSAVVTSLNKTDLEGNVLATNSITAKVTGKTAGIGNLVIGGNLTTTSASGKIGLTSGALGTIDDKKAASAISGQTVTLIGSGGIHVAGAINSANTLTLTAAKGDINTDATAALSSSVKDVKLTALNNLHDLGSINAVTGIAIKTSASSATNTMTIGNLTVTAGGISVVGTGLSVGTIAGSTQSATSNGKTRATILIEDSNKTQGTLSIASTITTGGTSGGSVSLAVGKAATKGSNPLADGGPFHVVTSGGGGVFSGAVPGAIVGPGTGQASLTAQGASILMNSVSAANTITFTNTANVTADPSH